MDQTEMRRRVAASFVAHLATSGEDGRPHIVPICYALDNQSLYFAVDFKPKRTTDLKRLRNIAAHPAVSILVDHYEDDWDKLWWVRMDGNARAVKDGYEVQKAVDLLALRYAQYRGRQIVGPVVAVLIERMSGWSAS
jgi:PPOX class probable F420-dependent enzyme